MKSYFYIVILIASILSSVAVFRKIEITEGQQQFKNSAKLMANSGC